MRNIRIRAIAFAAAVIMCCGALSFAALAARPGGEGAVSGGAELSAEFGRTVTIRNKVIEGGVFSFDAQLYGADPEGFLTAALYEKSGRMADLKIFPAQESVRFSFAAGGEPDCVKVVWTDKNFRPLTGALQVTVSSAYLVSEDGDTSAMEHVADSMLEYKGEVFEAEYIDNELILAAAEGAGREDIEKLLAPYGASIYDAIDSVGHYCVTLGEAQSGASLSSIADELRASALLDGVYFNTVSTLELCAEFAPDYPSDDWGIPDTAARWNEGYPFGYNWGVEAINLGSARRLLSDRHVTDSVSVGVIDSMFDAAHPDLSLKHVWVRSGGAFEVSTNRNALRDLADKNKSLKKSEGYVHGTHVAGTIAAPENGSGVTGVAAGYAELYCMGYRDDKGNAKFTVSEMEKALELLFKNASDKKIIINYSNVEKGKNGGCVKRTDVDTVTDYLKRKLSGGYDFLIAAAAGNADGRDPAEVSIFNAVTDAEVASRIIVVGGVARYQDDGDGKYKSGVYEDFALMDRQHFNYNYGGRIDVAAPGEYVYSTVPPGQTTKNVLYDGKNNEYARMVGTSQATPHVTGTAALVWAANKTLTGAQVKRLILDTADVKLVNDDRIKMINAAAAVAGALKTDYVPGGKCGDSVYWKLDTTDNTLTISGSGAMYDYSSAAANVPWYRYLKTAKGIKVVIGDQVTGIGKYAFVHLKNGLRSVEFGTSLEKIGQSAFEECAFLSEVSKFPASLKEIGEKAFYNVAAKEFRFSSVSPEITVAERSSKSSSFYNGTAEGVTLYYPAAYKESWDPAGTGKWNGYSILPYGRTVRGNAVDSDTGEPVEGAVVSLSFGTGAAGEMVTKTDEKGAFEFSPEMEGALYVSLDIKHANYQLKATSGTLAKDESIFEWKDVKLDRLYPVTLKVTDEKDRPVSGASVYISELGKTVKTGSDGTCAFQAVNGTYLCRVETEDGASADDWVTVNAGPAEHTVVLDTGIVSVTVAVISGDGKAVSNVKILGTKLASDPTTGSDGAASFEIKKGSYTFSVSTTSYYGSTDVSITGDAQVTLTPGKPWHECTLEDGVLTINGAGILSSFSGDGIDLSSVTMVIINGVNGLEGSYSNGLFNSYWTKLTTVVLSGTVAEIGPYVFRRCPQLDSVIISDGVTGISGYAFENCPKLSRLTIPASVTKIGEQAFYRMAFTSAGPAGSGCDIEFGWTAEIPDNAFKDCSTITRVVFPNTITRIGASAFQNCTGLTGLTLPDNVVSIGHDAFSGCTGITEVSFGSKLVTIGNNAFKSCALTSLSLPEGLTVIGNSAFYDNPLASVRLPGSLTALSNNPSKGIQLYQVFNSDKLTNAGPVGSGCSIEYGWNEEIPDGAFKNIEKLVSVIVQEGVTRIGSGAFSDCTGLVNAQMPQSLREIGSSAFSGCTGLTGLTLPDSVTTIDNYAFSGCTALSEANFGDGLVSIGIYAFENCALTRLRLPEGLTEIGYHAFYGDPLSGIYLPGSLTTVTNNSYYGGNTSESIKLSWIFDSAELTTAGPEGSGSSFELGWKEEIPDNAFQGVAGLVSVIIPEGVSRIGNSAFSGCTALEKAEMPESLQEMGSKAFEGCAKLAEITLPASIDFDAFSGCSALARIVIPASVDHVNWNAFRDSWPVNNECTAGPLGSGCNIEYGWAEEIPAYAFCDKSTSNQNTYLHPSLTGVIFPDSVTSIGKYAFYTCSGLTGLSLPESLEVIEEYAFSGCSGLTGTLTIPEGVTKIKSMAFAGCSGLTGLSLPESLQQVNGTFRGCTGLTRVVIPEGIENLIGTFENCTGLREVQLPESLLKLGGTFRGCTSLTEITLPQNLSEIGAETFASSGLTSITIPEGVKTINSSPFKNCTSLKHVIMPASDGEIYYDECFEGCTGLTSVGPMGSGCDVMYYETDTIIANRFLKSVPTLQEVIIGKSITKIYNYSFFGLKELKRVVFQTEKPIIIYNRSGDKLICENPLFESDATVTVYYPENWSLPWPSETRSMAEILADLSAEMGGNLTWIPYDPAFGVPAE